MEIRKSNTSNSQLVFLFQVWPYYFKEMEILVGLGPDRVMVCSKIGMVCSTPSRKLLRGTGAYFASFRNPRSWQKITSVLTLLSLTTTALQPVQRSVQFGFKVIFFIQRFSPPWFKKAAVVSTGTLCKNKTFDKWMENTLWSAEYTDIHKCRGHWRNA